MSNNLNGKVLYPIIDFNLIVNTEVGLIRIIRDNFQDSRAFNLEILNKSDREILSLLYSRKNSNPLSIISTEENMPNIDKLYKSFFDNYKKEIFSKSVTEKNMVDFVTMAISAGLNFGINCTICINDDDEREQITSHFGKCNFVYKKEKDMVLTKDVYYVRGYNFFTNDNLENKIKHKKIYISPTNYNLEYIKTSNSKLATTNQFIFIGKDFRINKGESDNE